MTDLTQAKTTQYITADEFQQTQQTTTQRMGHLEQALQRVEGQLEASRRNSLNEMHRLLDERLERERRVRQSEIDDMRRSIDSRLGALETKMDGISGDLKALTGRLSNWSQVIAAREKAFDEREARLEQTQREHTERTRDLVAAVDTLSAAQMTDRERLQRLGYTVLGDREGGRPSLYQLLEQTRDTVTARFDKQDVRLTEALNTTEGNTERLDTLKQYVKREQQKWQRRRKQVLSVVSHLTENRWLMSVLAGLAVLLIVALVPDARDTALFLLEQIFNDG